jgi:predicted DNA-binding transcriptional regulator YafY
MPPNEQGWPAELVFIDYTNHRGERAWRSVTPISIRFGSTEWHPEAQWLLRAYTVDRGAEREFAMKDIHAWRKPRP